MNRFDAGRSISLNRIWHLICALFVAGFLLFFISGISFVDTSSTSEQAKNLEISLRRSIVQCYSIEGTYPPSLDYLKEHYGFSYDDDLFYIDYIALGSNIMPDITILPKSDNQRR